jgi:hypothetical protein
MAELGRIAIPHGLLFRQQTWTALSRSEGFIARKIQRTNTRAAVYGKS